MEPECVSDDCSVPGEKNKPGFWRLLIFQEWKGEKHKKGGTGLKETVQRLDYQNPMAGSGQITFG
jgi:hypothetical protein